MGNYKRTYKRPGRPALYDTTVREYKDIWLQPQDDSRVPMRAHVFEDGEHWRGYRHDDSSRLELVWPKGVWKIVADPLQHCRHTFRDTKHCVQCGIHLDAIRAHELQKFRESDVEDTIEAELLPPDTQKST